MLSIVLPSYYEEENVDFIYDQIVAELPETEDVEMIFVDDGSKDNTFEKIAELSAKDKRVIGIRLSRNFGHQVALFSYGVVRVGVYLLLRFTCPYNMYRRMAPISSRRNRLAEPIVAQFNTSVEVIFSGP